MKLSCNMTRDLVAVYTDGAASEDTERAVREHLAACPACARYYYDYARVARARRASGARPVGGTESGYRALSERLRRRRRNELAVGLSLLAAVLAAGLFARRIIAALRR